MQFFVGTIFALINKIIDNPATVQDIQKCAGELAVDKDQAQLDNLVKYAPYFFSLYLPEIFRRRMKGGWTGDKKY